MYDEQVQSIQFFPRYTSVILCTCPRNRRDDNPCRSAAWDCLLVSAFRLFTYFTIVRGPILITYFWGLNPKQSSEGITSSPSLFYLRTATKNYSFRPPCPTLDFYSHISFYFSDPCRGYLLHGSLKQFLIDWFRIRRSFSREYEIKLYEVFSNSSADCNWVRSDLFGLGTIVRALRLHVSLLPNQQF